MSGRGGQEISAGARIRRPVVWGNIPQRVDFTGRAGLLRELRKHLTEQESTIAILPHTLHGLGGLGKTELAIEYAYTNRGEYDVVWWVSADQPWLILSGLAALAPHLDLPTAGRMDESVAAVLDALHRGEPYKRWLLIFDSANQPETLRDVIPHGPGHVLITSRNHRWEGVVDTIEIDVFNRQESLEFLDRRIPGIPERDADRLADELGDLPFALQLASAFQRENEVLADEYLDSLSEEARRLLASNPPSDYQLPVAASFYITAAAMPTHRPETFELLRLCASFGPEPISFDLLDRICSVLDLDSYPANPKRLARAMRDLGRYGLARIDDRARTVQIANKIAALTRDESTGRKSVGVRHDVHLILAAADPGNPYDPASWPAYRKLLPIPCLRRSLHVKISGCVSSPSIS